MSIDLRQTYTSALLADAVYVKFTRSAIGPDSQSNGEFRRSLETAEQDGQTTGLRFTRTLANYIAERFNLLDVYDNPLSGFYGAIFQEKSSGQLYMAFRGTNGQAVDYIDDGLLAVSG